MPPIDTVTGELVTASGGELGATVPEATAGVTAPRPVQKIVIKPPLATGCADWPVIDPAGWANVALLASKIAPGPLPDWFREKMPGENWAAVIVCVVLVCPLLLACTFTEPGATLNGICAFTWPAATKNKGAGVPLKVMVVPFRVVERGTEEATAREFERFEPKMATMVPGATGPLGSDALAKLAPLTTPPAGDRKSVV